MATQTASRHSRFLREVSKFAAGLVAADLISIIWFLSTDLLPITVWGMEITEQVARVGIVFDVFLLFILVNYAWHPRLLEPSISQRKLLFFVGVLTGFVGLLHVSRLALELDFSYGNWVVPLWLSWVGAIVTLYISYASFHLRKK